MRFLFLIALMLVMTGGILRVPPAIAQVMQSTSYRIQDDSINVGGGYATSTTYREEDTTGEIATGFSSSTNYAMSAGYQEMHETYLALSSVGDVTMSPALGGVTGGTSNGATTVTVTTDSYSGYQLTIAASTSPAMQTGAATIPDYTPGGAAPDYSFSNGVAESQFGFSPEGTDVAPRYLNNGSSICATGSSEDSLACWDGLSTTARTIATRTTANHSAGTDTTIRFRVGIGASVVQLEGTYVATSTLTALPL